MEEECIKCGAPVPEEHVQYDGLYALCPWCAEEWDDFRLSPEEEEALFADSDISLAEWEALIANGTDD